MADDPRSEVLKAALKCVTSDRNLSYGEPEDNFERIAVLHRAYWQIRPQEWGAKNELDVAIEAALTKVARMVISPSLVDHYVDIAGYIACAYKVALERPPNPSPKEGSHESPDPPGPAVQRGRLPDFPRPEPGSPFQLLGERQIGAPSPSDRSRDAP